MLNNPSVFRPFSLDIENPQIDLLKTARELGTAIVAYSPIGRGILGGKLRSRADFGEGDFRAYVCSTADPSRVDYADQWLLN
jgi:aryl-alcohol dehydrogenase-like predicted oxidoreductase